MVRSMTGYGKASGEVGNNRYSVEVKSLNSKKLDLRVDLPSRFREKEMVVRNRIGQLASRGKFNISLSLDKGEGEAPYHINQDQAKVYKEGSRQLAEALGESPDQELLPSILRLPEVVVYEKEEVGEEEWSAIEKLIEEALQEFNQFSEREGSSMRKDLQDRLDGIRNGLKKIEEFDQDREDQVREKLRKKLENHVPAEKVDENRFEQEIIYYLEKLDITEEKVRLEAHCDHFEEMFDNEGEIGKRLGFIAQEIGREVNTIGSKANNVDIQRIVVEMKDDLEKIKEQSLNIL